MKGVLSSGVSRQSYCGIARTDNPVSNTYYLVRLNSDEKFQGMEDELGANMAVGRFDIEGDHG